MVLNTKQPINHSMNKSKLKGFACISKKTVWFSQSEIVLHSNASKYRKIWRVRHIGSVMSYC